MDVVIAIMQDLDDAKAELEELNECGDLEDRLEAAQKVSELQKMLDDHYALEEKGRHIENYMAEKYPNVI